MMRTNQFANAILGAILGALILALALIPSQHDTALLFGLYFPAFAIYALLVGRLQKTLSSLSVQPWLLAAVLFRITLIFLFPKLSDDFYRFYWDGLLWASGINPFDHLPTDIINRQELPEGITAALFESLNSPEYHTVYPPVSQLAFWLSVSVGSSIIYPSMMAMKVILFASEGVIVLWLLPRLLTQTGRSASLTLWYALNPLVLIEIMGNMHFEGLTLCFLLGVLYQLRSRQLWKPTLLFAFSVATKLTPLLYLPMLLREFDHKTSFRFLVMIGGILIICFIPLLTSSFLPNFLSSIDLYFRNFEFNASIYYLARWVGYHLTGYNQIAIIGPALSVVALVSIFLIAFLPRSINIFTLPERMVLGGTVYLVLSTTVHPWYTLMIVGLAPLTRFRYPYLWSGLAFLSYAHYSGGGASESGLLICAEYLLTGAMLFNDLWRLSRNPATG